MGFYLGWNGAVGSTSTLLTDHPCRLLAHQCSAGPRPPLLEDALASCKCRIFWLRWAWWSRSPLMSCGITVMASPATPAHPSVPTLELPEEPSLLDTAPKKPSALVEGWGEW